MKSNKLPPPNELLRRRPGDEERVLKQVAEMLQHRDPLAKNPKIVLEHIYTLVRPDELLAAEFLWSRLCKHYRIGKTNAERLRYAVRVMTDYSIIEAHTHLHEPLFERHRQ